MGLWGCGAVGLWGCGAVVICDIMCHTSHTEGHLVRYIGLWTAITCEHIHEHLSSTLSPKVIIIISNFQMTTYLCFGVMVEINSCDF